MKSFLARESDSGSALDGWSRSSSLLGRHSWAGAGVKKESLPASCKQVPPVALPLPCNWAEKVEALSLPLARENSALTWVEDRSALLTCPTSWARSFLILGNLSSCRGKQSCRKMGADKERPRFSMWSCAEATYTRNKICGQVQTTRRASVSQRLKSKDVCRNDVSMQHDQLLRVGKRLDSKLLSPTLAESSYGWSSLVCRLGMRHCVIRAECPKPKHVTEPGRWKEHSIGTVQHRSRSLYVEAV